MIVDPISSKATIVGCIGGNIDPKPSGSLRISSINPGDIQLQDIKITLQHVIDQQIDIQCFSEVNLDTNKNHIQHTIQQTVMKMGNKGRSPWGSSKIPAVESYKPGGTGIASFGDHAGRIKAIEKYPYGRWSYHIPDGKNNIDVLIISVYQCCARPTTKIGGTAFHQQQIQFIDEGREELDPRGEIQMIYSCLSKRRFLQTQTASHFFWVIGMKNAKATLHLTSYVNDLGW